MKQVHKSCTKRSLCEHVCIYLIMYYKQYKGILVFGYKPHYKYTHPFCKNKNRLRSTVDWIPSMKHVVASQYRKELPCIQQINSLALANIIHWVMETNSMEDVMHNRAAVYLLWTNNSALLRLYAAQEQSISLQNVLWEYITIYLYTFDPCSTVVPFDIHIDFSISNIAIKEKWNIKTCGTSRKLNKRSKDVRIAYIMWCHLIWRSMMICLLSTFSE